MEKLEFKQILKDVLREHGRLSIDISEWGGVSVSLSIDDEDILESVYVDIVNEIEYNNSEREARAWV